MRLLDRYLLRELLVPLAYILGGFLVFYVAFDLIFGIKGFQEKHLSFGDMAEYYVATLPEILVSVVIPVSFLLALLYALTNHSRHHELTAMRAAGVGLWRLAMPYLGMAALLGSVVLAMNELLVPPSADHAKSILQRHDPNPASRILVSALNLHNEAESRDWEMDSYNRVTSEMHGVRIAWDRPDRSKLVINATNGIYTNGAWAFFGVDEWLTQPVTPSNPNPQAVDTPHPALKMTLSETPAWINSELKVKALSATDAAKKPQLSIREILEYLRLHPHQNRVDHAKLMTQLQGRLAEPFTCLVVVLVALPFGARSGRHNVFAGVASSLGICFVYFIMQRFGMSMGVAGTLPPFLAAWLPNLVLCLTGLVLIWRVR